MSSTSTSYLSTDPYQFPGSAPGTSDFSREYNAAPLGGSGWDIFGVSAALANKATLDSYAASVFNDLTVDHKPFKGSDLNKQYGLKLDPNKNYTQYALMNALEVQRLTQRKQQMESRANPGVAERWGTLGGLTGGLGDGLGAAVGLIPVGRGLGLTAGAAKAKPLAAIPFMAKAGRGTEVFLKGYNALNPVARGAIEGGLTGTGFAAMLHEQAHTYTGEEYGWESAASLVGISSLMGAGGGLLSHLLRSRGVGKNVSAEDIQLEMHAAADAGENALKGLAPTIERNAGEAAAYIKAAQEAGLPMYDAEGKLIPAPKREPVVMEKGGDPVEGQIQGQVEGQLLDGDPVRTTIPENLDDTPLGHFANEEETELFRALHRGEEAPVVESLVRRTEDDLIDHAAARALGDPPQSNFIAMRLADKLDALMMGLPEGTGANIVTKVRDYLEEVVPIILNDLRELVRPQEGDTPASVIERATARRDKATRSLEGNATTQGQAGRLEKNRAAIAEEQAALDKAVAKRDTLVEKGKKVPDKLTKEIQRLKNSMRSKNNTFGNQLKKYYELRAEEKFLNEWLTANAPGAPVPEVTPKVAGSPLAAFLGKRELSQAVYHLANKVQRSMDLVEEMRTTGTGAPANPERFYKAMKEDKLAGIPDSPDAWDRYARNEAEMAAVLLDEMEQRLADPAATPEQLALSKDAADWLKSRGWPIDADKGMQGVAEAFRQRFKETVEKRQDWKLAQATTALCVMVAGGAS